MLNEISKIPTLSGKSRYPGKLILVYCFWFMAGSLLFAQSREEKVQQLLRREDVKVTELEKDLLKIEYPNGKVLLKNIADYQHPESSLFPNLRQHYNRPYNNRYNSLLPQI